MIHFNMKNQSRPTLYFPPINKLGNVAFRKVCNNSGADFVFTEMVRVEKIIGGDPFQLRKLRIPKDMESKTIVQIICEDTTRIEECVDKIVELKKIKDQKNLNFDIEIDGGINFDNNKLAIKAGANILVSGTTIFKNNDGNIKKNIELLKSS